MPVIAYKTMTVDVVFVQPRRIACDNCGQPYNYLVVGKKTCKVASHPFAGAEKMRESLGKNVQRQLQAEATKKNAGSEVCPFCQNPQRFMINRSRINWMAALGLGGLVAGAIGAASAQGSLVVWITAGLLGGLFLGWLFAIRRKAYPYKVGGRTKSDSDVQAVVAEARTKDYDPALYWYASTGGTFPEKVMVVPLPGIDRTSG